MLATVSIYDKMPVVSLSYTDDGFAIIKMQNGENRVNRTLVTEMTTLLDEVERNSDVKALITTGEGKFFSNGLDLAWMGKESAEVVTAFRKSVLELQWRLVHFPIPTVALINGHAFAAGAFIASSHDYRVMNSERGWISWNEIHVGLRLQPNAYEQLRVKLSRVDALREAVLFGRRIPAAEAKELGIVDVIAKPEHLLAEAKKIALRSLGPKGIDRNMLQIMKKDLYPRTIFHIENAKL